MNFIELENKVQNIDNYENKTLSYYNNLINNCTKYNEMEAVVYLYDHMIKNKIKPDECTFKLINRLHSKTIKENNKLNTDLDKNNLEEVDVVSKITDPD